MERFRTVSFEPGGQTIVEIHALDVPNQQVESEKKMQQPRQLRRVRRSNLNTRTWDAA